MLSISFVNFVFFFVFLWLKPYTQLQSAISPVPEKQDAAVCDNTFVVVALRTDHRPVRKYDSFTANCSPGSAGLSRRRKQMKSNQANPESILQLRVRISTASGSERRLTLKRRSLPLAVLIRGAVPHTQLQSDLIWSQLVQM